MVLCVIMLFNVVLGSLFGCSGSVRPKTISAQDSSARTIQPIFQSGTPRPILVGPFYLFIFAIYCFILLMCIKTEMTQIFRQESREII